ncbi:MAG: elongation factor P [Patescibacteria group bacterium]
MQQRKPVKKCILKNLVTGRSTEYSFKSGESVEEADLRRDKASFMYKSGEDLSFMVESTFETIELPEEMLGDKAGYLKEGLDVFILYFNDQPISVDLPIKISYKVIEADPGIKGNSSSNVMKDAVIETGKTVRVPLFIEPGENIVINTVEDEYVGREAS